MSGTYKFLAFWGIAWLYLTVSVNEVRSATLAKPGSTHPSFPLDAFSSPAFKIVYLEDDPVNNQTAIQLLRAGKEGLNDQLSKGLARYGISAKGEEEGEEGSNSDGNHDRSPFHAYLHRSSNDSLHVCTLSKSIYSPNQNLQQLDHTNIQQYRSSVLRRALELLAPLRQKCLYHHPEEWFSYSFCYGDTIRQFHAIPGTIGGGKVPTIDASQDSFILGRWRDSIESIRGDDDEGAGEQYEQDHSKATIGDAAYDKQDEANGIEQGSELMQLIHFSSIEDESLQSKVKLEDAFEIQGKGRYISQIWTDGTICKLNHEARTTEVQYHCAETPAYDRITLLKEVTTCNYVIVIETPRLCEEPALAQKEDQIREVHCRPILSDAELHERFLKNVKKTHASLLEGAKEDESVNEADEPLMAEDDEEDWMMKPVANEPKKGAVGSLQDQLTKIIEKIAAEKRAENGEDDVILEEIQVVVGMDETGELIVDTNRNGFGSIAEQFLKATKGKNNGQDDDEDDESDTEKNPKRASTEQWKEILKKVKDLKGSKVTSDGVVYQVMSDTADDADGVMSEENDEDLLEERMPQTQGDGTQTAAGGNAGVNQNPAKRPHGQPQRGNTMVREPESFAQRVERFYKAQEEWEKKEKETLNTKKQNDDSNNERRKDNRAERQHDEL